MPVPIIMPKFNNLQEESLIAEWLVKEGEAVREGYGFEPDAERDPRDLFDATKPRRRNRQNHPRRSRANAGMAR